MLEYDLDVSELERAWRDRAVQGMNAGLATAVREACKEGAREAVNSHVYQDRTAQLTASIHGDEGFVITANGAEGQITAGETYASYVEAWERTQGELGFMDHAAAKAEAVLNEGIEAAGNQAASRFDGR